MFELLWLLFSAVLTSLRSRQDLALEHLLLRHQLAVLTRPTRTRPRARLRTWDKLLWVLARRLCARWRGPARSRGQTWRTFLRNHAHHLWAADLFTVPTFSFKTLYVVVFIAQSRRELVHVNVTANPTSAWVWRQVIEATPWRRTPRHLLRDRDAVYGHDFRQRTRRIGIGAIATPIHAPRANAIGERVIGTLRREWLDHISVLDEQHLIDVRPDRICPGLQPRAAASDARLADAGAATTPCD